MHKRSRHEALLHKADTSVRQGSAKVVDTYRLHYHFSPQAYWMNDPNGLVYYDGWYHVFYQHHPYSPDWGSMHWGHARTRDFINWEHLPIALAPSEPYDADGCFSGSAAAADGMLQLFFTGHRVVAGKVIQVQCRAFSRDGIHFEKDPDNPLIKTFPPDGSEDFRDPKVWKHGDLWYMVIGSGKDGCGKALLYTSPNLRGWEYVGVLLESDGTQGTVWECPDVFQVDGKHVLTVSAMGIEPRRVFAIVGEMDYETGRFHSESVQVLDYGPDFYAPQTFFGTDRRIMLAWMDSWEGDILSKPHNWAGAFTLPRELTLDSEGRLRVRPVVELEALRKGNVLEQDLAIRSDIQSFAEQDLERQGIEVCLQVDLADTTASDFGIRFTDVQNSQQVSVGFIRHADQLYLDTSSFRASSSGTFTVELPPEHNQLEIRLFLDRSSIEVFVNDGEASFTARIYPLFFKLVPQLYAVGGDLRVRCFELWNLEKQRGGSDV